MHPCRLHMEADSVTGHEVVTHMFCLLWMELDIVSVHDVLTRMGFVALG